MYMQKGCHYSLIYIWTEYFDRLKSNYVWMIKMNSLHAFSKLLFSNADSPQKQAELIHSNKKMIEILAIVLLNKTILTALDLPDSYARPYPGKSGCSLQKDLAKTHPPYLLDRQFRDNLLFGQANISIKNFQWLYVDYFGILQMYFSYKPPFKTTLKCKLHFLHWLLNVVGIRNWSRLVAKSGQAAFLKSRLIWHENYFLCT